jgi:HK97 gp10 family phage protein
VAGLVSFNLDPFRRAVHDAVAARLEQARAVALETARRLVPVRTGQLKASIGATVDRADLRLVVYADAPHAAFVELGTSRMAARPFLRPALMAAGQAFGGGALNLEVSLPNTSPRYAAGYQARHGETTIGRRGVFRRKVKARVKVGRGRHE